MLCVFAGSEVTLSPVLCVFARSEVTLSPVLCVFTGSEVTLSPVLCVFSGRVVHQDQPDAAAGTKSSDVPAGGGGQSVGCLRPLCPCSGDRQSQNAG